MVGALVAIAAVIAAVLAYRGQNRQLQLQQQQITDQQELNRQQGEVLKLQAAELRQSLVDRVRVAARERRTQASQVFLKLERVDGGGGSGDGVAAVHNSSGQPIYDVRPRWAGPSGEAYFVPQVALPTSSAPIPLSRLDPGTSEKWVARVFGKADFMIPDLNVTVEFRDAHEVWWRIKPDGRIGEIEPPTS